MNMTLSDRIELLLHQDEFDPGVFNAIEKEGDTAFELLRSKIDTHSGRERARGINLLLMLCRQFCLRRLPEAVRVALAHAGSQREEVRSAAVSAAIRGSRVARAFRELQSVTPATPSRDEVAAAVGRALALGVDEEARREAEAFLRGAPPEIEE